MSNPLASAPAMPDGATQGLRTNNAVLSNGMKALVAAGLAAPVIGGGFRLLSNLVDQSKPTPDPALPVSVIPIPVPKRHANAKAAVEAPTPPVTPPIPFTKEDNLSPLGSPLYRATPDAPKSFLAGHYADRIAGIPWFGPAAVGIGAIGGYGGYKLVDSLVNRERKKDLQAEVDDAKHELMNELHTGYKHASEDTSLARLAAGRCQQLFGKQAEVDPSLATPAEYQSISNLGGMGAAAGSTLLAGLLAGGAYAGYHKAKLQDPARVAKERARKQIADQWAVAPPEVLAVPQGYPGV